MHLALPITTGATFPGLRGCSARMALADHPAWLPGAHIGRHAAGGSPKGWPGPRKPAAGASARLYEPLALGEEPGGLQGAGGSVGTERAPRGRGSTAASRLGAFPLQRPRTAALNAFVKKSPVKGASFTGLVFSQPA